MKTVFFLALFTLSLFAKAQTPDSLFIAQSTDSRWYAQYTVQTERSVFDVAKKFDVPAAALADANGLSYADKPTAGTTLKIPLTTTNWYNYNPPVSAVVAPLFFRTTRDQSISELAKELGVAKRQLEDWNALTDQGIKRWKVIKVGWISLAAQSRSEIVQRSEVAPIPRQSSPEQVHWPDTSVTVDSIKPAPVLSPMEQTFLDQTAGGTMVTTEKGPAAFFPAGGGTVKGVHYAFHNSAPRGSIVRVHNIGTGRTVYVKVLGPLPGTKQYAGAIIGISAAAKAELGVRGDARAWCEVSYAGY